MNDEERWREIEPPGGGPSAPPNDRFNPLASAFGVFAAIAIPVVVIGYTRPSGVDGTIIVIGIVLGALPGFLAGLWVASRGGQIWRGPRL